MLDVVICDDDKITVEHIKTVLCGRSGGENGRLSVREFYDAETLFEYLSSHRCDLIYLDIEMGEMNGVELGRKIREEFGDYITKIVYISSKDGYVRQLLDVQPLGFISKPLSDEKILQMLYRAAAAKKQLSAARFFTYTKKHDTYKIPINDIIYFENLNHVIRIVTTSGMDEFYDTIHSVLERLDGDRFIKVHRSYYVNFDNIKRSSFDALEMCNGQKISISRSQRKYVRDKIAQLLRRNSYEY